jgi:hypothetical protein
MQQANRYMPCMPFGQERKTASSRYPNRQTHPPTKEKSPFHSLSLPPLFYDPNKRAEGSCGRCRFVEAKKEKKKKKKAAHS